MNIKTSYFGSKAPAERKVCIAKKCPKFCECMAFPDFAPLDPFSDGDWRARYQAELHERYPDAQSLRKALDFILDVVEAPILCCYERDRSECHRDILARYIEQHLGFEVPEWAQPKQHSLLEW